MILMPFSKGLTKYFSIFSPAKTVMLVPNCHPKKGAEDLTGNGASLPWSWNKAKNRVTGQFEYMTSNHSNTPGFGFVCSVVPRVVWTVSLTPVDQTSWHQTALVRRQLGRQGQGTHLLYRWCENPWVKLFSLLKRYSMVCFLQDAKTWANWASSFKITRFSNLHTDDQLTPPPPRVASECWQWHQCVDAWWFVVSHFVGTKHVFFGQKCYVSLLPRIIPVKGMDNIEVMITKTINIVIHRG